jgi:hypothetical protein
MILDNNRASNKEVLQSGTLVERRMAIKIANSKQMVAATARNWESLLLLKKQRSVCS